MKRLILAGLVLILFLSKSLGQELELLVKPISSTIHLDGRLDEYFWEDAVLAHQFQLNQPFDSVEATLPTEVRVSRDQQYFYIGAICHTKPDQKNIIQSLKRDFDFHQNESFAIFIDAFSDANSGLAFAVSPYGVQLDAIIPRGGTKELSLSWDALWYAEVFRNEAKGFWSLEIAIPFKTLRFKENNPQWRINFARIDMQHNEFSTWKPVPRGFSIYNLAHMGILNWSQPPTRQGNHAAVIPYTATKLYQEGGSNNKTTNLRQVFGLDAKIALSSSLNLDFTLNPDFSQVEVDDQVIDLNRFEISFPEKRILFLENSDLFAGLGNSRVRPFFSRRIGSLNREPVPVKVGIRLSGKLNENWRVGLMSVQTGASEELNLQSQNYTVAAAEKKVFSNSSLTGFITNRLAFDKHNTITNDFNTITGVEFNYRSKNGKWDGKAFFHQAFSPNHSNASRAYSAKLRYTTRVFSIFGGADRIDENYKTDLGFVPRLYHENQYEDTLYRIPYIQCRSNGYYRIYPKSKSSWIAYYGPGFSANLYTGKDLDYQEHEFSLSFFAQFLNSSRVELRLMDYAPRLFFPFQLSGMDAPFLAGNYRSQGIQLDYRSDTRQVISTKLSIGYGGEYGGKLTNVEGELNFRKQPWGVLGLTYSYRNLSDFEEVYSNPNFTLLGSKFEISFNRNLFFTTYLQYNTQKDNFNINSRFQWRFKPMSDLFLVYTENYTALDFTKKNRAVVLKINYWLNL